MALTRKVFVSQFEKAFEEPYSGSCYCEGVLSKDSMKLEIVEDDQYADGSLAVEESSSPVSCPFLSDDFEYVDALGFTKKLSKQNGIWELKGSSISFDDKAISGVLPQIQSELGVPDTMKLKRQKVIIFAPSEQETPNTYPLKATKDQQAHLFVLFPSKYTGGGFTLSRNTEIEGRCDLGGLAQTRDAVPHWIAFFSDIDCSIARVKSGYMVGVLYRLVTKSIVLPAPNSNPNVLKLAKSLEYNKISSFAVVGSEGEIRDNETSKKYELLMGSICRLYNGSSNDVRALFSIYRADQAEASSCECNVLEIEEISESDSLHRCPFDFQSSLILNRSKLSGFAFTRVEDSHWKNTDKIHVVFSIVLDIVSGAPWEPSYLLDVLEHETFDDYHRTARLKQRILNGIVNHGDVHFYFILMDFLQRSHSICWKTEFLDTISSVIPSLQVEFTIENMIEFIGVLGWQGTSQFVLSISGHSPKHSLSLLTTIIKCSHENFFKNQHNDYMVELKGVVVNLMNQWFKNVPIQEGFTCSSKKISQSDTIDLLNTLIDESIPNEVLTDLVSNFFKQLAYSSVLEVSEPLIGQLSEILLPKQLLKVCESVLYQRSDLKLKKNVFSLFRYVSKFVSPDLLVPCLQYSYPGGMLLSNDLEKYAESHTPYPTEIERLYVSGFLLNESRFPYSWESTFKVGKIIKAACNVSDVNVSESVCEAIRNSISGPNRTGWVNDLCKWAEQHFGSTYQLNQDVFYFGSCALDACLAVRDTGFESFAYDRASYCCNPCTEFNQFLSHKRQSETFVVRLTLVEHVIGEMRKKYDESVLEIKSVPMRVNSTIHVKKLKKKGNKKQMNDINAEITQLEYLMEKVRPVSRAKSARKIVRNESEEPPAKVFKTSAEDSGRNDNQTQ